MTHYYLYIAAGATLDADTHFFKVGIGESEAQLKKKAWLEAYAFEHGHFFVQWSLEAVEFYMKCQESIGDGAKAIVSLSAVDAIKLLKAGCDDPAFYQAALHRHKLLLQIDPEYYCNYHLKKRH